MIVLKKKKKQLCEDAASIASAAGNTNNQYYITYTIYSVFIPCWVPSPKLSIKYSYLIHQEPRVYAMSSSWDEGNGMGDY